MKRFIIELKFIVFNILNVLNFKMHGVKFDNNNRINGLIKIKNAGKIIIGANFMGNSGSFANPIGGDTILRFITYPKATLYIEKNVGISNSTIVCSNSISIKENTIIGGGTRIWDTDFHSIDPEKRNLEFDNDIKTKPIVINRNVFIGGGCIILKGVTVGENSIIGAGSIVRSDIPPNAIAAGNPCRVIKYLEN
jgi:NDP-sugar pyrophosphorylase family protein